MNLGRDTLLTHVAQLREAKRPVYVAATGAGAGLQDLLWSVPGCSAFLVGAAFPYSPGELTAFLSLEPNRSCCEDTAILMALEAYDRARQETGSLQSIGLGLTATVSTNREHKGDLRCHIATVSQEGCRVCSIVFDKATADRGAEAHCCNVMGLNMLLQAAGCETVPFYDSRMDEIVFDVEDPVGLFAEFTQAKANVSRSDILFPGAFNPIHRAHRDIVCQVEVHTGRRVVFAIEATMPHKPGITFAELLKRRTQVRGGVSHHMVITNGDALYVDKVKRFNCDLIMGADALHRMMSPEWGPSVDDLIREFRARGTTIYVFDRVVDGKQFRLVDCEPANRCPNTFKHMPGQWDESSTALRGAAQ